MGAWIRSDQRQLTLELETFLDAGEPPVYFAFGSMRAPQEVSQAIVEAARAVGRRAIVSRGWAGVTLPDIEPDCLSIGEVNLQALFRRVAAVVHHGGAGTTSADSLTEALSHTLKPDVTARARAVAASVRTDGPEIAARRLIDEASRSALGNESRRPPVDGIDYSNVVGNYARAKSICVTECCGSRRACAPLRTFPLRSWTISRKGPSLSGRKRERHLEAVYGGGFAATTPPAPWNSSRF
jgi:hypothetical protein